MTSYYDTKELEMFGRVSELTELLTEKKRILIACAKANIIGSPSVSQLALEFTEISETILNVNRNEVFSFYKRFNFFKAGIMVEFLN